MGLVSVGLSYRVAPLEALERLAIAPEDLPDALSAARAPDAVREVVVLSTCNRTELYARVSPGSDGPAVLEDALQRFHGIEPGTLDRGLTVLHGDEVVAHLFAVAAGIDSMAVGESQILAQVRRAFRVAEEERAAGPVLSALFRRAIRVGRRARAETGIARGADALARAGAVIAREIVGSLGGKTVLVVGAGSMGERAVATFGGEGARVLVSNRTPERAGALAARVGGSSVPLADLGALLREADVVLASTGSATPVITAAMVARAMRRRSRPLVLLDLAVPRDVEPSAARVDGVVVRDLDDLRDLVAPDAAQLAEVARVRALVAAEVPKFARWRRAHAISPQLAALHAKGERVGGAEVRRMLYALQPEEG